MTRVSPPELARELPGPHASTSVTRAPPRRRYSAVQPPNAPAPTTTTEGLGLDRGGGDGRCCARARAAAAAGSAARSVRRLIRFRGGPPHPDPLPPRRGGRGDDGGGEGKKSEERPRGQAERPRLVDQVAHARQQAALAVERQQRLLVRRVVDVERDVEIAEPGAETEVEDVVRGQLGIEDERVRGERTADRVRQRARTLQGHRSESGHVVADLREARADVLERAGQVSLDTLHDGLLIRRVHGRLELG